MANAIDRETMVHEARKQLLREQKDPFDASNIDHMGIEEIGETKEKLESEKGEEKIVILLVIIFSSLSSSKNTKI